MAKRSRPSLRLALYGLVAAASLLPALVLAPWLVHEARSLLLDRAMLRQEMFHQQVELRLATQTRRLFSVLENKSDPIGISLAKPEGLTTIRMLLERILERESMVTSVSVYGPGARLLARVVRSDHVPPRLAATDAAWVIPMHARNYLGAPERLPDGHVEFVMAVPARRGRRVAGVVLASVRVDALWNAVRPRLPAHEARVYLVDSRGALLAALDAGKHATGELLTSKEVVRSLLAGHDWRQQRKYRGVEGDAVFGVATLIPELKWGVISEVPARRILKPIASDLFWLAAAVILLHVLFGVVALALTRRVLNPLNGLMALVRSAGRGEYQAPESDYAFQEAEELAGALRRMVDEIARREESLRKLSMAVEQAAEAVLVTDRNGVIEYVNRAFTEMSGYAADEVIGHKPSVLKSGEQGEDFYRELWGTITRGEVWEGRLVDRRKDGSRYPVFMTIAPVREGSEITHFIAIQQDISKQDELEAQFRQAQKMEALGSLVGGIAHDFNNSLAAIGGNLYMMRQKAAGEPELMERIEKIDTLVQSSAKMIAQLLTFARKDVVSMGEVDLCALARETVEMMRSTLPSSLRLVLEADCEAMMVEGDTTQIRQMLINLIVNARDAVAGVAGAEIRVSLDVRTPGEALRHRHDLPARPHACLSVCDNGCGMDEETQKRIFEPFFTTKEIGKGSGLGLAMVFGAIERHHGAVDVQSAPGEGSCFLLYFPLREQHGGNRTATDAAMNAARGGDGEMLLLVDDNPDVREPIREMLEGMGYAVLDAADGAEGLSLFCEHEAEVELVITDAVMPEMSGPEMLRAIRQRRRDMPAIFITGYDPHSLEEVKNLEHVHVLTKPVPFDVLAGLVAKLLEQRAADA